MPQVVPVLRISFQMPVPTSLASFSLLSLISVLVVRYLPIAHAESAWQGHSRQNQSARRADDAGPWYTRYPAYPPYCSTPEEMETRKVPPLPRDKRFGESRLQHVTAVARHGARTPYTSGLNCWQDYTANPETAVWDCNMYAYLSTPPSEEIAVEEGTLSSSNNNNAMFLFEKRYDALQDPLSNLLGGTCQVGQLLLQGYEQELKNGQFLRDAYVYDGATFEHDERMRLLDRGTSEGNVWDHIHYRVDDEERTLMSGQVILRGLLGPEMESYFAKNHKYPVIPLHTADYSQDILYPNEAACPRLTEVRKRNEASPEYQAFNQSAEAILLRQFQHEILQVPNPNEDMEAIDCLMTTMCTDRPLPDSVNDYRPPGSPERNDTKWSDDYGKDLLQRLYEFQTKLFNLNAKAENGEYSKLGMSFLWNEILTKINGHIEGESTNHEKLHLISGHDTTLIPLLAALGVWNDTVWPSYASMILIELHELNIDGKTDRVIYPSDFAFRLIYNGVVITSEIAGCPENSELCDVAILLVLQGDLQFDCERKHPDTVHYQDAVTRTREIVSTTQGIIYFLLLVSGSAIAGGLAVYVYMARGCSSVPRTRYRQQQYGHESSYDESGNGYHDESDDPSERSVT